MSVCVSSFAYIPEVSRENCRLALFEVHKGWKTLEGVVLVDPVVRDLHKVDLLLVQLVVEGLHHLEQALGEDVLVLVEEDEDVVLCLDPPRQHHLVHLLNLLWQLKSLLGCQPSVISNIDEI